MKFSTLQPSDLAGPPFDLQRLEPYHFSITGSRRVEIARALYGILLKAHFARGHLFSLHDEEVAQIRGLLGLPEGATELTDISIVGLKFLSTDPQLNPRAFAAVSRADRSALAVVSIAGIDWLIPYVDRTTPAPWAAWDWKWPVAVLDARVRAVWFEDWETIDTPVSPWGAITLDAPCPCGLTGRRFRDCCRFGWAEPV